MFKFKKIIFSYLSILIFKILITTFSWGLNEKHNDLTYSSLVFVALDILMNTIKMFPKKKKESGIIVFVHLIYESSHILYNIYMVCLEKNYSTERIMSAITPLQSIIHDLMKIIIKEKEIKSENERILIKENEILKSDLRQYQEYFQNIKNQKMLIDLPDQNSLEKVQFYENQDDFNNRFIKKNY
ncbi:hypothetical protein DICPUDRAFT_74405 [Dictyostelium purpureum]|uniref:Uncharacterized protein n=1 Tax=Dictyostelium purpureum TaxID=5786 RepID=F0Z7M8_DICPU|nr:uncharacterized protein DICPUDRAFT_74405 [Dictyostelium purpureum]EGC40091.1 hypothetical protein DICPUDRAFT_74405 [Dictyostelium purpureum]|eukprot:XP_003283440.1 hypothetical protein DICPUDRAFT_74405 [Dictyostelium purpureum]